MSDNPRRSAVLPHPVSVTCGPGKAHASWRRVGLRLARGRALQPGIPPARRLGLRAATSAGGVGSNRLPLYVRGSEDSSCLIERATTACGVGWDQTTRGTGIGAVDFAAVNPRRSRRDQMCGRRHIALSLNRARAITRRVSCLRARSSDSARAVARVRPRTCLESAKTEAALQWINGLSLLETAGTPNIRVCRSM